MSMASTKAPDILHLQSERNVKECYKDLLSFVFENVRTSNILRKILGGDRPTMEWTVLDTKFRVQEAIDGLTRFYKVQPGDKVCLVSNNHVLLVFLYLAVIGLGAVVVTVDPEFSGIDFVSAITWAGVRHVFADGEHVADARLAVKDMGLGSIMGTRRGGLHTIEKFLAGWHKYGRGEWLQFDSRETSMNTIACLCSTRETVDGQPCAPKFVPKSHYDLVMEHATIDDPTIATRRRVICSPITHGFAAPLALISPMRLETYTYLMNTFDPNEFAELVERKSFTEAVLTPAMLESLLRLDPSAHMKLKSLKRILIGNALLDPKLQQLATAILHDNAEVNDLGVPDKGVDICQVWSMIESSWMAPFISEEHDGSGSVGRLLGGYEAKLMPCERDKRRRADKDEIWVRGPFVMKGYLKCEFLVEKCLHDGWLKTGAIGHFSEDGRIHIEGLVGDLIKIGDHLVSPDAIESQLMVKSKLLDAGVIGTSSNPLKDDEVRVYVVPQDGIMINAEVIKQRVVSSLSAYGPVECRVHVVAEIPKNAAGTVLRNELRKLAQDGDGIKDRTKEKTSWLRGSLLGSR